MEAALTDGYRGIRVVADNTPLVADPHAMGRWLEWEHLTDRFQAARPMLGVCDFGRTQVAPDQPIGLATLPPVLGLLTDDRPPFQLYADEGVVKVVGNLEGTRPAAPRQPHPPSGVVGAQHADYQAVLRVAQADGRRSNMSALIEIPAHLPFGVLA